MPAIPNYQIARLASTCLRQPVSKLRLDRGLSTTSRLAAKNDSSSIDYFKFPDATYAAESRPEIQIPSFPDSWTNLNSRNPVDTRKAKPTDEFQPGDVVQVAGSGHVVSKMTDGEPITKGQSELLKFFEASDSTQKVKLEELSAKDKTTLTYLFAGVVAWWLLGSYNKKDEENH